MSENPYHSAPDAWLVPITQAGQRPETIAISALASLSDTKLQRTPRWWIKTGTVRSPEILEARLRALRPDAIVLLRLTDLTTYTTGDQPRIYITHDPSGQITIEVDTDDEQAADERADLESDLDRLHDTREDRPSG